MDAEFLIELYGYLGSALVVISMLMASVVKLRVVNTVGSVVSGTYALIIGSFPLALMNGCLIVINVYNLLKLLRSEKKYDLVRCGAEDPFVRYFLARYGEDIRAYFPDFQDVPRDLDTVYLVCCEGNPAGILMGKAKDGTVDVAVDYSVPAYRDCSVGRFLYSRLPAQGIRTLVFSRARTEAHSAYLAKMKFTQTNGIYTKKLV